ncbi:hypothetical protein ABPG77_002518 [Micractinium sp. CCAP 211/92]
MLTNEMRKQQEVAAQLQELGEEALEERLRSATSSPARPPHRLTELIASVVPQGRPVLVLELARGAEAPTSEELGQLAAALVAAGADALAVKTDAADTPEPLKDLLAVSQSAGEAAKWRQPRGGAMAAAAGGGLGGGSTAAELGVPVLQRDWYLHPIQIVAAKEAGAAGVIGTIASVTSRGTPLMSSFASAVGLDCPVEVVNMQELQAMERFQVPFFGMNLSVGLSVSLQGFGLQVAKGLLGELPFGAISMVGARSIEEARQARLAGADSLLIKWELVQQFAPDQLDLLMEQLRDATSGDD